MALGLVLLTSCGSKKALTTVNELDKEQYLGTWYEIQRFPHSFEKDLQCVTATYTLREDGKINVLNKGFDGEKWREADGKAWTPNADKPGELKVEFFWPFAGDYYIIETDPAKYSLVGAPDREYLWILAREKSLDDVTLNRLRTRAEKLGSDISKLEEVHHNCEE
ncbi:lipocalin [Flavobacteriaceae bacterium Ap0902]|nr:lipocalin [Flavobacteriaceae bacterium Ap0902]